MNEMLDTVPPDDWEVIPGVATKPDSSREMTSDFAYPAARNQL